MTKHLIILGAGGHGKVAADCAALLGRYSRISFLDALYPQLQQTGRWPVIGKGEDVSQFKQADTEFFVAIGSNQIRQKVTRQLLTQDCQLATLIHPMAYVSQPELIGAGTLVCANAVVNIDSKIGLANIINTGSSVDHDCVLGDFVHIAPGVRLAGAVCIGESSFIGIGSVIIPGKIVGSSCILGAGSTLLTDLADYAVAVGSPAKVIKQQ
ncbi:acetyltransferase [Paraglaciecola hydrolytica]|uniref:Acyltransferase n=1 Tax=Paraglaciecola hydrolytica TaxID=1799789 RepID=A0A148KMS3_9ALTE|nr:acetyltransferase [Paraglaciecola hydrolytica]KXI27545.1 acyltransferase [Paraglaciecola hydrolytica]